MKARFHVVSRRLTGYVRRLRAADTAGGRSRARKARRAAPRLAGPRLIRAFAAEFPQAVFVEIGANDGLQHDHLRAMIFEHDWRGVMVEPVPYVFERLQQNYRTIGRVALENVAIGEHDGRLPFYHLAQVADRDRDGLPEWYDGIGSFSPTAVLGHRSVIPDIERRLVQTEVPCLTFETLCAKHRLGSIDLIVVDTEGYDYMILKQIDFSSHRPVLVVYEHFHLAAEDRSACREHLRDHGYQTMEEGFDTWCLHADASRRLARTWSRLRPGVPGVSVHDLPR